MGEVGSAAIGPRVSRKPEHRFEGILKKMALLVKEKERAMAQGRRTLEGERSIIDEASEAYPDQLRGVPRPPQRLYCIGNPEALSPGLAVVGARKATPYGTGCARRFARIAAEKGVVIDSGGALGCDSEAHRAALEANGTTVVVLGGGCDCVYPARHFGLFQKVIDAGGAIISEQDWLQDPMPFMFRERNRIIAGLASAVLIVEAGLPSGTFSTADEALDAGRDVLVVPGSIASEMSRGANRLLLQGAIPVVDDQSFEEALFKSCGMLMRPGEDPVAGKDMPPIIAALQAQPLDTEQLYSLAVAEFGASNAQQRLMELLVEAEADGAIARQPDGKWGPTVRW